MIKKIYLKQFDFEKKLLHQRLLSVYLIENIQKSADEKKIASGVFIDLEKSFDTVDHTLLLNKLSYYGIYWRYCK